MKLYENAWATLERTAISTKQSGCRAIEPKDNVDAHMPADPFAEWLAAISLAPGPLAIHDALDAVDVESFADAQVPLSQSKSQPLGIAFVLAEIERHGAHEPPTGPKPKLSILSW